MKTIIYINKNVPDYDILVSCVQPLVQIKTDLEIVLHDYNDVDRIGFVWENNGLRIPWGITPHIFINGFESKYWTKEFIEYLFEYKKPILVDLITCCLNSIEFQKELTEIKTILPNVIFNYSNTKIGNTIDANWILESSNEDISLIYFTNKIKNYSQVLGFPTSIPNFTQSDSVTNRTFTLNNNITIGSGTGEITWTRQDITYSSSDSSKQLIIDGNGYTITINQAGFDGMFISGYTSGTTKPTILKNFNIVSNMDIICSLTVITGSTQFSNCKLYLYGNISNDAGGICYNDGSGGFPSSSGINTQLTYCSAIVFGKIGQNAGPLIGYINLNSGNVYNLENCSSVVVDNNSSSLTTTYTLGSGAGAFVGSGISNTVNITTSYCIFNGSMSNGSGIIGGKYLGSNGILTIDNFYAVTNITYFQENSNPANTSYLLSSYFGGSPFNTFSISNIVNVLNLNTTYNLEHIYGIGGGSYTNTIYDSLTGFTKYTSYSTFNSSITPIGLSTYTISYSGFNNTFYSFNTNPLISWVYDLVTDPNTLKAVSQLSSFSIPDQTWSNTPFTPTLPTIILGNGSITYSSNDTLVATVNNTSGLINMLKAGNTIINATLSGSDQYIQVIAPAPFTINKASSSLSSWSIPNQKYSSIPFTPTLPIVIVGNGTLSYSSSNTTIATVNNTTGETTMLRSGTVTIFATLSSTDQYEQAISPATFIIYPVIVPNKYSKKYLIKLIMKLFNEGVISEEVKNKLIELVNQKQYKKVIKYIDKILEINFYQNLKEKNINW